MTDGFETRIQFIDGKMLTPLVRRVTNLDTADIVDWENERVHGGTFGIVYRFSGRLRNEDKILPWSLILKVVHNRPGAPIPRSDPSLAYQSGFLDEIPGGLAAPRCFDVVEQAEDEIWLWLEDVADAQDGPWSIDRCGLAARHLGQFNGAFMAGQPMPTDAWLGKNLLRTETDYAHSLTDHLATVKDHPINSRLLPEDVVNDICRLWDERELFIQAMEKLSPTICHRDTCRINLFHRLGPDGVEQTVAIDWEDVALGRVGEDIVPLVILGLGQFGIDLAKADDYDATVFEQYLAGLRDSGWRGTLESARFGYSAGIMRYALILPLVLIPKFKSEDLHSDPELAETVDRWAGALRFALDRIDEARDLYPKIA